MQSKHASWNVTKNSLICIGYPVVGYPLLSVLILNALSHSLFNLEMCSSRSYGSQVYDCEKRNTICGTRKWAPFFCGTSTYASDLLNENLSKWQVLKCFAITLCMYVLTSIFMNEQHIDSLPPVYL